MELQDIFFMAILYGVPICLYIRYRRTHPPHHDFFYTIELDDVLDRVEQIREQLHRLERLQTEVDISKMDNCMARSIGINWGNRQDQEYVMQLVGDDTSDVERLIEKERIRLTTSLQSELAKIPEAVKTKGGYKTNLDSRGEGVRDEANG